VHAAAASAPLTMSEPEPESQAPAAAAAPDLAQIRGQVEYYFSDKNLKKDKFMKKQLAQSQVSGFVALDVLAGFNRMKALGGGTPLEPCVIADALESSEKLVLSDDRASVRRSEPLPSSSPAPSLPVHRTVVISGAALDDTAALTAKFALAGTTIVQLSVLAPAEQQSDGGEYGAKYATKHPAFRGREPIALVEYATEAEACNACETLDESRTNWRGGMAVSLLEKGAEFKARGRAQRQREKEARQVRQEEALAAREAAKQARAEAAAAADGGGGAGMGFSGHGGGSKLQSTLSGLAAQVEGSEPPKVRKKLQLTKRGAGNAVAARRKKAGGGGAAAAGAGGEGSGHAKGDGAEAEVEAGEGEVLTLAAGPSGFGADRRGFGAHWRRAHPWRGPDGQEQRLDPSDGVSYPLSSFQEVYGGLAVELWEQAG
jgi:hypothetical protein